MSQETDARACVALERIADVLEYFVERARKNENIVNEYRKRIEDVLAMSQTESAKNDS